MSARPGECPWFEPHLTCTIGIALTAEFSLGTGGTQ
jgi:hypothetical protein